LKSWSRRFCSRNEKPTYRINNQPGGETFLNLTATLVKIVSVIARELMTDTKHWYQITWKVE